MTERYTLEELYKRGAISYKPIVDRDIKNKVHELMTTGSSKGEAVRAVAAQVGWTPRSIYRSLARAL